MPNDGGYNYNYQPHTPDPYSQPATGPTPGDLRPTYPPPGGFPAAGGYSPPPVAPAYSQPLPPSAAPPPLYPPPPAYSQPAYTQPLPGAVYPPPSAPPQYAASPYVSSGLQITPTMPSTSGMATASLVLALVGLCTGFGGLLAVIFGHVALNQINRSHGLIGGKGMAVAGLIIGYIELGFLVLWLFISLAASAN